MQSPYMTLHMGYCTYVGYYGHQLLWRKHRGKHIQAILYSSYTISLFQKIVHRPDHLLPGYESAVNFFWHRRCITIPNNTALIMDICGQHGMKKRFIYVHYVFIDGITKLQNKSCYFKLETQLVLFQNIGAAFIVKLFRPTLWRWRYYPVMT